jgi:uncharacterized protein YbjT (DUF2867 family)
MPRKAALFGATGLIGSFLVHELLNSGEWETVVVFTRRTIENSDSRIIEIITDLSHPPDATEFRGIQDLFICLGTTIGKAGSQDAFSAVDLRLPTAIVMAATKAGVQNCAVVSSLGADSQSRNFYLKTKGLMEVNMEKAGFRHLYIFRPSMLLGPRRESRPAESAGKIFMQLTSFLFAGPLAKYRAIQASAVAKAMRMVMQTLPASAVFESDKIASISKKAL